MGAPAIEVSDLHKSYGDVEAVRGLSFEVGRGEVFGLLGPNGAGKTTTVEILEGYRRRDAGDVRVLGFDPGKAERAFRERIGVVLQESELWPVLTVREVHRMFAGYYEHPRDVDEVIELIGLAEKAEARVKTLSGGQRRRLDLALALVGDPDVVFLDEPTTGFNPAARRIAWDAARALKQRVGIVLQSCGFYPRLTVREAVAHMAKAYPHPRDPRETIALVGLDEKADTRAGQLSGGQQRRLDLALALVGDPELVFLDEPTTGFDPAARRGAWEVVRALRDLDKTVLLTTHYLDEAQALADRVAIVKDGRIVAEGPPTDLGPESGGYRVSYLSAGRRVEHQTDDPTDLLHRLTGDAIARGERLEGIEVARPTLEDVYLQLTAEDDEQ